MNRRFASVLLFAFAVSGIASLVVYRFVVAHMQVTGKPQPKNKLLVAAHDLQTGALVHEFDLQTVDWPGALPAQAITDKSQLVGRGVVATIYEGEPVVSARLAPRGAGAGLAAMIPVGKRAVALRVDEVVGLAGFVLPGNHVDVVVSSNGSADPDHRNIVSRTVLQNLEVLSAGQKIEKSVDGKPQSAQVVNLLVTPDQGETMSLASSEMKVQLVLRNPLDTKEEITHGTSLAVLLGQPAAPVRATPAAYVRPRPVTPVEPDTVEVFSGTKKSEQKLDGR